MEGFNGALESGVAFRTNDDMVSDYQWPLIVSTLLVGRQNQH